MRSRLLTPCAAILLIIVVVSPLRTPADDRAKEIENALRRIFEKHSFTIRNFYSGSKLRYDSKGALVGTPVEGYWSRDGFFEIAQVNIRPGNTLVFEGNRAAAVFNWTSGEFQNEHTDKLTVEVQLDSSLEPNAVISALYRVFLTGKEKLAEVAPSYWRACLGGKIERRDNRSPWECRATEGDLPAKNVRAELWTPPPDNTLKTGMQLYDLHEKIVFFMPEQTHSPFPLSTSRPFLRWAQRRVQLGSAVIIAFEIDEDGVPRQLAISTPLGMGVDDELVRAVTGWRFRPATRDGKPVRVVAKVVFELSTPTINPYQLAIPPMAQ